MNEGGAMGTRIERVEAVAVEVELPATFLGSTYTMPALATPVVAPVHRHSENSL
jgi:hypothetical protein